LVEGFTGFQALTFERNGPILIATLNRPQALNAVDELMHNELERFLATADDDAESLVIVLTGAGRGFCAGADISMMQRGGQGMLLRRVGQVFAPGSHLVSAFLQLEKPIIAMVNGAAVGLGATLALLCDAVFMADSAEIGDRHVNVGLVAGDGGTILWSLLAGPMKAKEALFTGRLIRATEAEKLGLITKVLPDAELKAETIAFAQRLAGMPPYALRATKAAANRIVTLMIRDQLDLALAWERLSMGSEENRQAVARFLNRDQKEPAQP